MRMNLKYHNHLKGFVQTLFFIFIALLFMPGHVIGGSMLPSKENRPSEPNEPILISFDYQGGQTRRKNNDPRLLIHADGTVFLGAPYGILKPVKTRISQDALRDLLTFAIDQNHFFDFDSTETKKAVLDTAKASGRIFAVADLLTTVIRIKANGHDHTVEYYALGYSAKNYPEITELQNLLAVQNRLQQLISDIRADEGTAGSGT